jgi:hypothetical protein
MTDTTRDELTDLSRRIERIERALGIRDDLDADGKPNRCQGKHRYGYTSQGWRCLRCRLPVPPPQSLTTASLNGR